MTKAAAFFDADETVVRGSTSYYFARELFRRGFVSPSDIAFAARQTLFYLTFGEDKARIDKISQRAAQAVAGHSLAELVAIGEELYDTKISQRIDPEMKKVLDQHLAAGTEVWLISATPAEMSELLARRLGATGGLGTRIAVKDGVAQPRLAGPLMHGAAKADAIREIAAARGLDLDASYAYSDSFNDLPMLSAVGHPIAVNPDLGLRRYAQKHGWQIRDYRRRRTTTPKQTAKRSAQIAGAIWFTRFLWRRLRMRRRQQAHAATRFPYLERGHHLTRKFPIPTRKLPDPTRDSHRKLR